ncbi:MAG: serine/threonine protein kinase [Actinobacteria bacterium]|nr:serine/threonine protein kinase [Actinomycetota bacterium]MBS1884281.1 serine/threonine protein kinase [Actinomycetota bacterium]
MTEELKAGDKFGDFEIVQVAGAGGMGVVYKARQRSLDRDVALKVIKDEIAAEPEYRERFLREAKLAASVDHPHVVTVYDVGDEDGRLYLVMQWIDGSDLRQVLDGSGRLTPKRAVAIGGQLAGALDAVHEASGLVHRDVKPANVLLREVGGEDHAYLTDFGVAKPPEALEALTRTGSTVGTTGYLAPEQIQGKEAGPRSDLYSLGCLTFEILTGKRPFTGENELAVRWAHAQDERPLVSNVLPALGHRYDGFFVKALAIDPDQRFASGREFAEALAGAQASTGDSDPTAVMGATHAATAIGPATPPPPRAAGQTPAPYGYATPPPQPHQRDRSGSPVALIVIGIVAVCGIAAAVLAASGVFTKETSPASRTVAQTTSKAQTTKPVKHVSHHQPKPATPPAGSESCPGASELWVNEHTSCPFAENAQSAYAEADGAKNISVYSPVTGKTYAMACKGTGLIACTGGNDAAVYFGSAKASGQNTEPAPHVEPEPTPEPEPEYNGGGAATVACDSNIYVNEVTSCPFAENVFEAYADEYQSNGESGYYYVEAYSEETGKTFGMDCYDDSDFVECSGGKDALVTFPMQAVRVY